MSFESRLMSYLEHAGVRGLTVPLAVHKARMDEITWTQGLIEQHFVFLARSGVLLQRNGYYRLAQYKNVEDYI